MPDGSLVSFPTLPVAVIGAGPVGLAAAAHLRARGLTPLVLEAGPDAAAAVRAWGHVRMFSPWRFNVDGAARALLESQGRTVPDGDAYPTGAELADEYLAPLARALGGAVRTGARVVAVSRRHHDLMRDAGRDAAVFVLHIAGADGAVEEVEAAAVIDCSGTWASPNPAGPHGLPAPGEASNHSRVAYGVPDVLGTERMTYAGKSVLVVGGGHSAMNVVLDLARLQREAPGTRTAWAFRKPIASVRFGGGVNDGLLERGSLGARARALVEDGTVRALAPFLIERIEEQDGLLSVTGQQSGRREQVQVDRMIVATGFRPDLALLRELRVALDPAVQAPPLLAPLIDPNVHSCGTVRPHGEAELRHPEPGFYIAGMKSYGRAPTFLMATGHEQVRSIVAGLAGDWDAARDVQLDLPETGVCSGPVPAQAASDDACCSPATLQGVCCDVKPELVAAAPCCGPAPARPSGRCG